MSRMEPEGTHEPERFDPRVAEPPAVPALIPVLRPASADHDTAPQDPAAAEDARPHPAEDAHP
ncbi:hypothetical protein NWP10_11585, partial [Micrococcus sp. HG099]